jgi:anti-sigma B factor antagonist
VSTSLIDSTFIPLPDVTIREVRRDPAVVLEVSGTIDMVTGPKFQAAVLAALSGRPEILVIDLSRVTFMAAAGLHVLDIACAEAGSTVLLAVVADGPATVRPIEICGLDDLVDLYSTIDDVIDRHAA